MVAEPAFFNGLPAREPCGPEGQHLAAYPKASAFTRFSSLPWAPWGAFPKGVAKTTEGGMSKRQLARRNVQHGQTSLPMPPRMG